jgi:ATP-dependent RNA helicase DeaD
LLKENFVDNPYEAIPEPQDILPEVGLDQLPDRLREAAARANWPGLMPVQARAIPYLFAGRNVLVQARTGSGKTGAYLLPMLERLNSLEPTCQALILVPTRELARQVWQETQVLCAPAGLRAAAVYGGVSYGPQIQDLKQGAHIVVGTPGRILDHLLKRNLSLERLEMVIYDEADRMLSMGFYPDMKEVQRYLPKRDIQTSMFSATFPLQVLRTAREFMIHPEFISLSTDHIHVTDVEHVYYNVPGLDKDRALIRMIELENPTSAIIFCNTKVRVHYVAVVLQRFGYDADELSADLAQKDRERVLERVRKGTLRFLVATDVAARGLDIPELSHVFQYELPEETEAYIHRAGRTGRAGAAGTAVSLVATAERSLLTRITAQFSIEMIERPLPSDADVEAVVAERLTALLESRLRERDKLQAERSRRFIPLARSLAESEDELPAITMLLDETYQSLLHAPVPLPEEERSEPPQSFRPPQVGTGARRGGNRRRPGGRGR